MIGACRPAGPKMSSCFTAPTPHQSPGFRSGRSGNDIYSVPFCSAGSQYIHQAISLGALYAIGLSDGQILWRIPVWTWPYLCYNHDRCCMHHTPSRRHSTIVPSDQQPNTVIGLPCGFPASPQTRPVQRCSEAQPKHPPGKKTCGGSRLEAAFLERKHIQIGGTPSQGEVAAKRSNRQKVVSTVSIGCTRVAPFNWLKSQHQPDHQQFGP